MTTTIARIRRCKMWRCPSTLPAGWPRTRCPDCFRAYCRRRSKHQTAATCHGCGKWFKTKQSHKRSSHEGKRYRLFCDAECRAATRLRESGGPKVARLCAAPCGCPLPRRPYGELCEGHTQRQRRGKPLNTQLQLRASKWRGKPGTCRKCGCTDRTPCEAGCAWLTAEMDLCTRCEGRVA